MDEADPARAELDGFLYHVTHDLKAYMRGIRMIPQWVVEDLTRQKVPLPREVSANLEMLSECVTGMDRMLDGLTELSRVGRQADPAAPNSVAALARRAWAGCPGHERMIFELEEDAEVVGPANDLARLFEAVLSNAVLHNDADPGRVRVTLARDGARVRVRVSDNGPGVEPCFRSRVFEPLVTLQPKDQLGTVGMGLTLARKIVVGLGGAIRIEEGDGGRGCAVVFDLPGRAPQ